jgi:ABC-type branched-subunit amino acid transport system ATPase component
MTVLLESELMSGGYGSITVVRDVTLSVNEGEVVALIGPNGAGKSTTLLTLAGVLPIHGGSVRLNGQATKMPLHARSRAGLGLVTEERCMFRQLTTLENLKVCRGDVDYVLDLFPELRPKLKMKSGLLSGGEQQMLALARALSRRPKVLLADELSLGLAPLVSIRLLEAVRAAADTGVGVLLVEQHVRKALEYSDRAYVMNRGHLAFGGTAAELSERWADITESYLSHENPLVPHSNGTKPANGQSTEQ